MVKKLLSVTSHALDPPVTNWHTYSDPLPSSVTYFIDGRKVIWESSKLVQFSQHSSLSFLSSKRKKDKKNPRIAMRRKTSPVQSFLAHPPSLSSSSIYIAQHSGAPRRRRIPSTGHFVRIWRSLYTTHWLIEILFHHIVECRRTEWNLITIDQPMVIPQDSHSLSAIIHLYSVHFQPSSETL